jgi:ketosteroid isomerase-like protein
MRTPAEIMEGLAVTWTPDAMRDVATADQWVELFDDDLVLIEPASLPHGGRHEGIGAFRNVQSAMRELWDQTIEGAEYWLCGDDRAALRIVIRWTARATGRSVTMPMIDLFRFRDGKVVEIEVFLQDTHLLLATL